MQRLADLEAWKRGVETSLQGGVLSRIPVVDALPPAGRKGRLLFLSTDGHLWKDTGAAWTNTF